MRKGVKLNVRIEFRFIQYERIMMMTYDTHTHAPHSHTAPVSDMSCADWTREFSALAAGYLGKSVRGHTDSRLSQLIHSMGPCDTGIQCRVVEEAIQRSKSARRVTG